MDSFEMNDNEMCSLFCFHYILSVNYNVDAKSTLSICDLSLSQVIFSVEAAAPPSV